MVAVELSGAETTTLILVSMLALATFSSIDFIVSWSNGVNWGCLGNSSLDFDSLTKKAECKPPMDFKVWLAALSYQNRPGIFFNTSSIFLPDIISCTILRPFLCQSLATGRIII